MRMIYPASVIYAYGVKLPLRAVKSASTAGGWIYFHRERSERFHLRASPEDFTVPQGTISLFVLFRAFKAAICRRSIGTQKTHFCPFSCFAYSSDNHKRKVTRKCGFYFCSINFSLLVLLYALDYI